MRHYGHRSRFEGLVVERAAEGTKCARCDIGDANAVGADHAHTAFRYCRIEFALHGFAELAGFRETAGQYHGKRNARLAAIPQRLRHLRARYRHQCHIARPGDGTDVRIRLEALHFIAIRIHRIQFSGVAGVYHQPQRLSADRGSVGGSADDGDGRGGEQAAEIGVGASGHVVVEGF